MPTSSLLATPWQRNLAEAMNRAQELREYWLRLPANYPPPPRAPAEAFHEHHQRWLTSSHYAHGAQLLRAATEAIPSSQTQTQDTTP